MRQTDYHPKRLSPDSTGVREKPMTLARLHELKSLLTADDDIAKLTITSEELSEIYEYQVRLLNAWGKDFSVPEVINIMIADLNTPRPEKGYSR